MQYIGQRLIVILRLEPTTVGTDARLLAIRVRRVTLSW